MATFQDTSGRVWHVRITVDTLRRAKSLGFDLPELGAGGPLLARLSSDPIALADLLWLVCQEQAATAMITDTDFGRLLAGDVIDQATEALLEGMVEFLPESRRRLLNLARAKLRETETATLAKAEEMLQAIDPHAIARQAINPPSPPPPSSPSVMPTPGSSVSALYG
jgi:hypothetical protein